MKRTLIIIFTVLIGFGGMAQEQQTRKEKRKEKQQIIAQKVDSIVTSRNYTFTARSANPIAWQSIHLSSNYSLNIQNDSIKAHLPYYGRAYRADISSIRGGIVIDTLFDDYHIKKTKGNYKISFNATSTKDNYYFHLTITTSGYASLTINSNNRQSITYNGIIEGLGL
jgi:hypothetical protein